MCIHIHVCSYKYRSLYVYTHLCTFVIMVHRHRSHLPSRLICQIFPGAGEEDGLG